MRRPLDKQGEGGRARLLEVASQLFIEHGYEGTPVSRIVREAGVTMPVLYYHFGNKKELFGAVIEARGDWFRSGLKADSSLPFPEGCELLVQQALDNIDEVRDGLRLRIQLGFASGREADVLKRLVRRQRLQAIASIGEAIARALPNASVRRRDWLAELFLAGVQALALEMIGTNGPPLYFQAKAKSLVSSLVFAATIPEDQLPELLAREPD